MECLRMAIYPDTPFDDKEKLFRNGFPPEPSHYM